MPKNKNVLLYFHGNYENIAEDENFLLELADYLNVSVLAVE